MTAKWAVRAVVLGMVAAFHDAQAGSGDGACAAVSVEHRFEGAPVAWHESQHPVTNGTAVILDRLDYLLSGVQLTRPDGTVAAFPGQYFLISAADGRTTFTLPDVPPGPWKSLAFTVGVDREANHADPARWPAGHALNPLENNLHWGWKGGYVFLAAEGRVAGPGTSPGPFLYHVGGDGNCARICLELDQPVADPGSLRLIFSVDRLWNGPSPVRPDRNDTLTHSSGGDDLAPRLVRNLEHCFRVERREP